MRIAQRRPAEKAVNAPLPLRKGDLATLRAMRWPGNVRELENVLERAVLLGDGRHLALEKHPTVTTTSTFEEAARQLIAAALEASGGRIHGLEGAAARLGLLPTTLQSKMRKLGFARPTRRKRRARRS